MRYEETCLQGSDSESDVPHEPWTQEPRVSAQWRQGLATPFERYVHNPSASNPSPLIGICRGLWIFTGKHRVGGRPWIYPQGALAY